MKSRVIILSWLIAFLIGSFDVVLAGGGGGGSKSTSKLSKAQIEEIAKDPKKLKTLTSGKSSRVKADAVARVLDLIAANDGINDPKVSEILTVAINELGVSPSLLGSFMVNSPNKNQVLAVINSNFGSARAQLYQATSGATFPAPPSAPPSAPPTENDPPPSAPPYPGQSLR
jgi:hypothetical protein